MARARQVLKNETIAIIGYGVQGPAQGLNLRDNGFKVIVGQAKSFKRDWDRAVADGWKPGRPCSTSRSGAKGHHHTDARFRRRPAHDLAGVKKNLKPGAALISRTAFPSPTKNRPASSRRERGRDHGRPERLRPERPPQFPHGRGHQFQLCRRAGRHRSCRGALPGRRHRRWFRLSVPTTFQHEVFSDLTGERGVLMGALAGIMEAQYEVLRAHDHSPSEAFNEPSRSSRRASSGLWMKKRHGLDVFQCSALRSAARGLEPKFKAGHCRGSKDLYQRVKTAGNAPRASPLRRTQHQAQLAKDWAKSTIPKCGAPARLPARLRPKQSDKVIAKGTKGVSGRTAIKVRKIKSRWSNSAAILFPYPEGRVPRTQIFGRFSQRLAALDPSEK